MTTDTLTGRDLPQGVWRFTRGWIVFIVIAIGQVKRKPVVVDEEIVIRSIMPITGTFDHRIVDGSQAGRVAGGAGKTSSTPLDFGCLSWSMKVLAGASEETPT